MNVPYLDKLGLAHFLQRLKGEIVTDAETDADDKPVSASVAKVLNENKVDYGRVSIGSNYYISKDKTGTQIFPNASACVTSTTSFADAMSKDSGVNTSQVVTALTYVENNISDLPSGISSVNAGGPYCGIFLWKHTNDLYSGFCVNYFFDAIWFFRNANGTKGVRIL